MTEPSSPSTAPPWRPVPLMVAVGLAGLWVLLAWWRPTTTWHLAPALIAGLPPYLAGWHDQDGRLVPVVLGSVVGAAVAGAAILGLNLVGWLAGPAMLGPDASVEAVIALLAGLAIGVVTAFRTHR